MKSTRIVVSGLMLAILGLGLGLNPEIGLRSANAAEAVRPEIGNPLKEAQAALKGRRYSDALSKLREADAVGGKSAYEVDVLERLRIAAATASGDADTAARSLTTLGNNGRLSASDRGNYAKAVMGTYLRAKNYKQAIAFAQDEIRNGTGGDLRRYMIEAQYLSGDVAGAARQLNADIAASERAGKAPSEDQLNLLANCYLKLRDNSGYGRVLERLLALYPKPSTWANALNGLQKKSGMSMRYGLDIYRLQQATGNLSGADAYMEMGQLAVQGGSAIEAKKIVDEGFDKKVLGTGANADRHKRLQDLVGKRAAEELKLVAKGEAAAKDAESMVSTGFAMVINGQAQAGLALMEKGIAAGGLRRPEGAKLQLGYAYLKAGDKAKASKVFKSIGGTDGAADLAKLWAIYANR